MADEQQMLENAGSNELTNNASSVEFYKQKNRGKKRKSLCYVDYDQATGEDDAIQNAASLTWPGPASAAQQEPGSCVKRCARESVTYEDDDTFPSPSSAVAPPVVRRRFHNNQFNVIHAHVGSSVPSVTKMPEIRQEHHISNSRSSELLSCVDPTVVASEKKEIFKKPNPPQGNTPANKQKRLTASQLRRIKKKERYLELKKKQDKQAKEHVNMAKPLRPCRYYQQGNCNKGKNCSFSHDCEIIKRQELCKFYLLSTCTRGLACTYYHGDWPCKFFHVFKFCMNGDACKFSHEPLTDKSRQLLDKSETFVRGSFFSSSSNSCDNSDVTWQEIGRVCGSVCSCSHPGSQRRHCHSDFLPFRITIVARIGRTEQASSDKVLIETETSKAMATGETGAGAKTGQQLSSDAAKENHASSGNHVSNGNTQLAVNYGASSMPQHVHHPPVNISSIYQPHQFRNNFQPLPANTAAVSMTLQHKIYHLDVIEFEGPVRRELPPYIDVRDPRWATDPRVQPCIPAMATGTATGGVGLDFYNSHGAVSASEAECMGQQSTCVGETSSRLSVTCNQTAVDIAMATCNSDHDCSSVISSPVNSICNVNDNISVQCKNSTDLSYESESVPVAVFKPVDVATVSSVPVARHTLQHNVSWLSATRLGGVQKLSNAKK